MQMRIGGQELASSSGAWIPVVNPATGEAVDRVPQGTEEDVDAAVDAAEEAFPGWSARTVRERGKVLLRAAAMIREEHKDLARLLTREQGKPIGESVDELRGLANILEFYGGISAAVHGDLLHLGGSSDAVVIHEPIGICGAIIPWNMPAIIMGWKVAPALLAGNAMIFKPASEAPLTVLRLAAILERGGLPPGVLNVVTGRGGVVGEAIVRHPAIRRISFTGDTATGHRIRELAASSLKEVSLELGGSDPMVVWRDADLDAAVAGAVRGRFYNAGQTCTAVKRLYLHEEIAGAFVKKLQARVEGLTVGSGLDPSVDMGPLVSMAQRERVSRAVEEVRESRKGAILAGGRAPPGAEYDAGSFYLPTLIRDPPPGSAVLEDEIFGPVLPVMAVADLDDALEQANGTRYGLGASVWTRDLHVAREFFSQVQAGIVWVNRHLTVLPEVPFGGVKESGTGRENGIQAYFNWTRTKSVFVDW
ncbi:MAG: aldehyde dehydrogenase family protein [Methanomicrobiales archaeon]|nr:aldehyde dehydrogenase family protein [Methanomicrobiales archaeon]